MGNSLSRALTLVLQTTPYMAYRAACHLLLFAAALAYLGALGLVGWVFGPGAFWALCLATGAAMVFLGLWRMLNEALNYFVRAGHVALLAQIAARGKGPAGVAQLRWARNRVAARFRTMRAFSGAGRTVRRTISELNGAYFDVESALPIQGLEGSGGVAERLVRASLGHLGRGVLGLAFLAPPNRLAVSMRAAILQYCQAWKPLLAYAVGLHVASVAFVLIAALGFMAPLGVIAVAFAESASVRFVLFLLAVGLGLVLKGIFFDPVADALMLSALIEQAGVQEPDPEWAVKAAEASARFRNLTEEAEAEMQTAGDGGQPPGDAS